ATSSDECSSSRNLIPCLIC
ncbi:hypothetical protein A2U01_0084807, partial [Trifolium medium]|nr:hypothetical protein [Trifolium medium]